MKTQKLWVIEAAESELLDQVVTLFVKELSSRSVVLLSGEVGSGKTSFLRAWGKFCHFKEVSSPTFSLHLRYENSEGQSLDHVDLYRLKSEEDLESSGFWDLFAQEKSWIALEWGDLLNWEALPWDWDLFHLHIEKIESESRPDLNQNVFEKRRYVLERIQNV